MEASRYAFALGYPGNSQSDDFHQSAAAFHRETRRQQQQQQPKFSLMTRVSRLCSCLWAGGSRRKRLLVGLLLLAVATNLLLMYSHRRARGLSARRFSERGTSSEPSRRSSSFSSSFSSLSSSLFSASSREWEPARQAVREMLRHSWRQYAAVCALTEQGNELAPVTNSCSTRSDDIVGARHLLTVVDALDTLALLGLRKEFKEAREMVRRDFRLTKGVVVSVFEVTIRLLGGFLGAFSLTEDRLFADKAVEVADALKGAFADAPAMGKTQLGGPGLREGIVRLAEAGSLYLEFAYLAEVTGKRLYGSWAQRNQERLLQTPNIDGVYPNHINVAAEQPQPADDRYTAGGEADSFYEYLVKRCLFDRPASADCRADFSRSLDGIMRRLAVTVADRTCVGVMGGAGCDMEHLTCFVGGMFALAYTQDRRRLDWLEFAENVTTTCYLSYLHSPTGLGPESFTLDSSTGRLVATNDVYLLRPETVESLYYLYHITGKEKYRQWGWRVVLALNKTARTSGGFSGVAEMSRGKPVHDNTQWSFFLAETLKYLYLLFSPKETLPLQQWVFNTEAHLLPSNRNKLRRRLASARRRRADDEATVG